MENGARIRCYKFIIGEWSIFRIRNDIDQGTDDEFLDNQLKTDCLKMHVSKLDNQSKLI